MSKSIKKIKSKRNISSFIDFFVFKRLCSLAVRHTSSRGRKMAIFANDFIGGAINVFGVYEKEELDVLFDFLSPLHGLFKTGVAYDVGANIGNHSIYFSNKFKHVNSFEPNPSTYYLLEFNLKNILNSSCYNIGLGDEKAVLKLYEDQVNLGGSSIKIAEAEENYVDVLVEKLDDFSVEKSDLCFIKIDVEGFESKVIMGGIKTVFEFSPIIVFEQHESDFYDGSTEAISLLENIGYKFCWHQSGTSSNIAIVRRLYNFKEIIFGRTHKFFTGITVPKKYHAMLLAVPPRFHKLLGI